MLVPKTAYNSVSTILSLWWWDEDVGAVFFGFPPLVLLPPALPGLPAGGWALFFVGILGDATGTLVWGCPAGICDPLVATRDGPCVTGTGALV